LSNLLHLNLYEAALQALPIQRTGVYLQENQGWEASLVYAWKVFGHGCLIGAPNASVRFWDLRYFFDPRTYDNKRINSLPVPDLVAVNGPAAKDAYLKGGYPEANLVTVEALRYLSINAGEAESSKISVSTKDQIRLLVMGDYLHSNTRVQMRLLEQAALSGSKNLKVLVKPHPSCPIQPADYPRLDFTVTTDSLSNLLSNCDVAYSSSLTAASLDAYCAGVPVISVLDPNQLNMSPLRGQKGGIFISTSEELENALTQMETTTEDRAPFFQLDPSLLGWMKLLIDKGRSY
jgi:surface carbohydrate biosynthesis protein (TIGR04326 family)